MCSSSSVYLQSRRLCGREADDTRQPGHPGHKRQAAGMRRAAGRNSVAPAAPILALPLMLTPPPLRKHPPLLLTPRLPSPRPARPLTPMSPSRWRGMPGPHSRHTRQVCYGAPSANLGRGALPFPPCLETQLLTISHDYGSRCCPPFCSQSPGSWRRQTP